MRLFETTFRSCLPGVQSEHWFDAYLADYFRLGVAEAAECEGAIKESEKWEKVNQVVQEKTSRLDGLPYEMLACLLQYIYPCSLNEDLWL